MATALQKPPAKPASPGTVAGNAPAVSVPVSAISRASAKASALKHGGNPTGRPTKDGLVPGTPEYVEARRKADAERKQINRAQERAADPPPIPSAVSPPPAPVGVVGPVPIPGQPGLAGPATPPPIPWTAADLKQICEQIVGSLEEFDTGAILAAAEKAGMPKEVLLEVEKDSAWPKLAKDSIAFALPELFAKYLNQFGISSAYKFELMVGSALVAIVGNSATQRKRITIWKSEHKTAPAVANPPAQPVQGKP